MRDQKYPHVGPGWTEVLVNPFLELLCMIDPSIPVAQIKEKFGTLNIYHGGPAWVETLANVFEAASEMCCEDCGRWDGHHRDGDENWGVSHVTTNALPSNTWIKTLCCRCRAVRQAEWDAKHTKSGDVV